MYSAYHDLREHWTAARLGKSSFNESTEDLGQIFTDVEKLEDLIFTTGEQQSSSGN